MQTIGIIGGGAAGFFAANILQEALPQHKIILFEKGSKVLSKVKVSGGGRCNVTNHCFDIKPLTKNYPRGEKFLYKVFKAFQPKDVFDWFEKRGVPLKTEEDKRVFPATNSSQTIIDCFLSGTKKVDLKKNTSVISIEENNKNQWLVETKDETTICDYLVVTTGGVTPNTSFLEKTQHKLIPPVPSLFTFKIDDERLSGLSGVSVPLVQGKIVGTKLKQEGPFLITHWGISGPVTLKTSAWGAIELAEKNYTFDIQLNFSGNKNYEEVLTTLKEFALESPKKSCYNYPLFEIPSRFWQRLCKISMINESEKWLDLSKKQFNKLTTEISQGVYTANGKSTFKDEFVTCGGVDLKEVNNSTMESKLHPNLFFAGEVLNIDAITGGYNFQAAWSTAYVASKEIENRIKQNIKQT